VELESGTVILEILILQIGMKQEGYAIIELD